MDLSPEICVYFLSLSRAITAAYRSAATAFSQKSVRNSSEPCWKPSGKQEWCSACDHSGINNLIDPVITDLIQQHKFNSIAAVR